ncbi:glycosyltransferase family 4 protein [Corynebacterium aquatimens]|uniref:Phosphatidylinositol alpha 1,6-mannosyltransferase n=1 Tax=Corynebacterium aquatimens TaxID=1190508 RepID=A0A931E4Q3_9CORY|nr:glycosyltransferase family 1 protein [Corynebacterium aquatimens]MBG6122418.1 phosphatidylinositol alpha 1,6-mannosyltransferase [Corynebacterium aquatimens]WJY65042.1 GDP-mannose-dependent alpha-mannosyltransferase [Corynebacterium aquatimens]
MRVAIVTESFLPNVNGVTNSVLRVLEHCKREGHEAIVIAPGALRDQEQVDSYQGFRVVSVPAMMVPMIDSLPVGVPMPRLYRTLKSYKPDVVHLASPFVLGGAGAFVAKALKLPTVALFQTDVAGFAATYRLGLLEKAAWGWTRALHNATTMTLAPSSMAIKELEEHGIRNVHHWGRGVDSELFNPEKRSQALRDVWDPTGEKKIVGFVGRLASEKGVRRLAVLDDDPAIQLVIVGDGPERRELGKLMPNAVFTGELKGEALASAFASLDLFVHTGEFETFCQALQEAQASGVPTIGPRAGGPVDLVQEDYNGKLLDVATFERDLPAAAHWILDDSRLDQLKLNARQSVQNKTWPALCEQLIGYYQQAIAEHAAR